MNFICRNFSLFIYFITEESDCGLESNEKKPRRNAPSLASRTRRGECSTTDLHIHDQEIGSFDRATIEVCLLISRLFLISSIHMGRRKRPDQYVLPLYTRTVI